MYLQYGAKGVGKRFDDQRRLHGFGGGLVSISVLFIGLQKFFSLLFTLFGIIGMLYGW